MKKQTKAAIKAHIIRGASYLLLLLVGTVMVFFGAEPPHEVLPRTLSFAERVAYQRMIEDVYWRHRIWPKDNPNPKPSLDPVMSQGQLEKRGDSQFPAQSEHQTTFFINAVLWSCHVRHLKIRL